MSIGAFRELVDGMADLGEKRMPKSEGGITDW